MGYLEVMVLGDVPAQSVAHLDWRWLKAVAMLQQVGEVFPGMPVVGVELRYLIPNRGALPGAQKTPWRMPPSPCSALHPPWLVIIRKGSRFSIRTRRASRRGAVPFST